MAKDNLEVDTDDDTRERSTPSRERQQPAASEVGTSPLAKRRHARPSVSPPAGRRQHPSTGAFLYPAHAIRHLRSAVVQPLGQSLFRPIEISLKSSHPAMIASARRVASPSRSKGSDAGRRRARRERLQAASQRENSTVASGHRNPGLRSAALRRANFFRSQWVKGMLSY
jgi:hypothetical protein